MSFQIDTAFVKQYHDNVEYLLQQKSSRLQAAVRVESQEGEESFWEQIGTQAMQEVSVRFGDSPQSDTPHARRRVTLRQFDNSFPAAVTLSWPSSCVSWLQNRFDVRSCNG